MKEMSREKDNVHDDASAPSSPSQPPSPATDPYRSPDTSPHRSPPTSPSVATSPCTPKTFSPSSHSSSENAYSPHDRKRKLEVHQRTIRRRRLRVERNEGEGASDADESEGEEVFIEQDGGDVEESEVNNRPREGDPPGAQQHCVTDQNSGSDSDSSTEESGESDSNHSDCDSVSSNESQSPDSVALSEDSANDNATEHSLQSVEYLYDGSEMTAVQGLLEILQLFVEERWTKTSLDKSVKLVKRMLPDPNSFPTSGRAALKQLELLTSSCSEVEYLYCNECLQLSGSCNHTSGVSKFYSFPIREQIKFMFEQRGLASAVEFYKNHHSKKEGFICDITDGEEYKKVREQLSNVWDLVLLWNTDGVSLSGSSKQELWPILCTICEVPPRLRASFIIVAGVYVGKKKPNMNVYLKPFCNALQSLFEDGVSWVHPVSKETIVSKVVAPVLSADAPARALVLVTKNFNSRFGCNICEQKTKIIPLTPEEIEFNQSVTDRRKKKRRKRRFLFQEDTAPAVIRSGARMDRLGELAENRGSSRKGVLGKAVISDIPLLDRAACVAAEYLHLLLLGVTKYFLSLILFTKGPWYIGDKLDEINRLIDEIKVPDYIKRLPSNIDNFHLWKASDFRAFLLYYSLPIFRDLLPDLYFQHWLLLVASSYIFLKDAISEGDLQAGEIMLKSFVRDIGELYGEACYLYNCHTLLHIPLLVRRWGPLWSTGAFVFEAFNGYIGDHIHGTKHLGKELIENIKIFQSVAILDNIVNSPSLDFLRFPKQFGTDALLGKGLPLHCLDDSDKRKLNSCNNLGCYVIHSRAKLSNVIFTSTYYDNDKKRNDSFIQFKSEKSDSKMYGQIIVFVKAENASMYCLVKIFKVNHVKLFYHKESRYIVRNLVPIIDTNELSVLPVDRITMKVFKVGMFIVLRPNTIEINL